MATLDDIVTQVLQKIEDDQTTTSTVESYVQTRYQEFYTTFPWSRRLRDFTISLVAQVSGGTGSTVSIVNGDATVESAGFEFTSGMVGRQIDVGGTGSYYFIGSFTDASNIELGDGEGSSLPYAGTTASLQTPRVFQTIYTLPSTADSIITLTGSTPLTEVDGGRSALDTLDPDRTVVGTNPSKWLWAGVDSSNVREIEIWPIPTESKLLRGQMQRDYVSLTSSATLDMSVPLLVFAVSSDLCHNLHSKQGTAESMWANKAAIFEAKAAEIMTKIAPAELDKLSLPTSLNREFGTDSGFRGTDFEVDRQLLSEFPSLL